MHHGRRSTTTSIRFRSLRLTQYFWDLPHVAGVGQEALGTRGMVTVVLGA